LLSDGSVTLATIDLARYEVTNVAVRAWSAPDAVGPLLSALGRIEDDGGVLASSGPLIARASELVQAHEIAVYDAAYVAAAEEGDRTLVSCDVRDLVSKGLARLP
jgi:predicted nucleic acid-binding protein